VEVKPTTPRREATSIVIGVALLAGVGAYFASMHRVPFLCTALEGLAALLWWVSPPLLPVRLQPVLLSSIGFGLLVFFVAAFFTPALEKMCGPRLSDMENQMRQRKRQPRLVRIR
jgi:hypothetical protein